MTAKTITKSESKIRKWYPRKCCWIILIFIGLAVIALQYISSPYQKHIIVSWSMQQGVRVMFKALAIENIWGTRRLSNDTKLYTKPDVNTSILLPQDFCHHSVHLLIITASAPGHSNLRNAIRETWASYKNISIYNISTYFLMGQTYDQVLQENIRREFKNYSDIIQEEFIDGAYNRSLKSLMMLKIVTTYCPGKIKYLLKTDDDVYVNEKVLEGFIKSEMSNLLVGHQMVGRKPIRDDKLKSMYCPLWMYGDSVYPTHLYGHNYVQSADVVPKLYNASKYFPHFFIEGVYITVEGWEYNISRDTRSYILPENVTTLLIPTRFCKRKSDLLIITTSTPSNFGMRTAIRDTWGSLRNIKNFRVNLYFIIGQVMNKTLQHDIVREFRVYNDLIQEQFIDTYNNLTLKTLMALKLVKTRCADRVKFLMKTDDDTFVNVVPLVKSLRTRNPSKVLLGHRIHRASPIRDATSKWNAPLYLYKDEVYPDYLSGAGYVMSFDIVIRLYEASLRTPIYYLEDIYITGILSREINLKPKHHPGFTYTKRSMDACLYEHAITSHYMNESEIRVLYQMIQKVNYKRDCKRRPTTKRLILQDFGNYDC